ncbi:MAG: hypothetical protein L6V84_09160 [Oscillospiraceae bacterium]|nr:MAG: hypothetical protein L6V84_09160 [Oscillospiraceae bacterium]
MTQAAAAERRQRSQKAFTALTLSKSRLPVPDIPSGWSTVRNGSVVYAPGGVLSANGNRTL